MLINYNLIRRKVNKIINCTFIVEQILQESKQKLWLDMRDIFRNVSNFNLFNAIISLNEKQLEDFIKQSGTDDSQQQDEIDEALQWHILQKQAGVFHVTGKYAAACKERLASEQEYVRKYDEFEDKLMENFIKPRNLGTSERETLMRDYLLQYTKYHALKSGMNYLQEEAEWVRKNCEASTEYLSNHEVNY